MPITLSANKRRAAATLMALVAASLPIVNILNIICSTGADNLSGDLIYHVQALSRILSLGYAWQNILRDSFYNGRLMFFPTLLRIAYWNAYVELIFGLCAKALALCLAYTARRRCSSSER
ncbi:MAG: hypothetical protein M1434_01595 [Chloroflexi bacterium]|nr:hypothetical protein [Chloroflexota bacterium]MCL5273422.1 hypothetical protein [Chloroflexota bacterium]